MSFSRSVQRLATDKPQHENQQSHVVLCADRDSYKSIMIIRISGLFSSYEVTLSCPEVHYLNFRSEM